MFPLLLFLKNKILNKYLEEYRHRIYPLSNEDKDER